MSVYCRGKSKSRHCAYIRTILIEARIFSVYVRGNSKSRRCVCMRKILIIARSFSAYVRGELQISSLCVYPANHSTLPGRDGDVST